MVSLKICFHYIYFIAKEKKSLQDDEDVIFSLIHEFMMKSINNNSSLVRQWINFIRCHYFAKGKKISQTIRAVFPNLFLFPAPLLSINIFGSTPG